MPLIKEGEEKYTKRVIVFFEVYFDAPTGTGCATVQFDIGSGDSSSRSWDITVIQYECGHGLAGRINSVVKKREIVPTLMRLAIDEQ